MSDAIRCEPPAAIEERRTTAELLPVIYRELRQLAALRLSHEKPGQTLQATALVHEVYLRLMTGEPRQGWDHRGHFFSAAAEAMRRILIERATSKGVQKRHRERVELTQSTAIEIYESSISIDLLTLNEALIKLEALDPRKAELVKLRFFAGLTVRQAAAALGISTSTVDNDWAYAKTWLRIEMSK
ncbi:MAG: sigma-70 family RNA polymerase sigma factor [Planctomycetales bacterium]|nr:sigma-70 family RNA polymerase sigma factor [Planctomycetales bacterium]MCA9169280.1 sigma-70 family RNA polymerase sigma factor [Planctomycetales bacterium]